MLNATLISAESIINCLPKYVSPWTIYSDDCLKHIKIMITAALRRSKDTESVLIKKAIKQGDNEVFQLCMRLCFLLKYRDKVTQHKNTANVIYDIVDHLYQNIYSLILVTPELLESLDSFDYAPDMVIYFVENMLNLNEFEKAVIESNIGECHG